jgi:hypothetical protein
MVDVEMEGMRKALEKASEVIHFEMTKQNE